MIGTWDGFTGYGEVTPPVVKRLETDEDLRERLNYVAGGVYEPQAMRKIMIASGEELDRLAEEVGLKRRTL